MKQLIIISISMIVLCAITVSIKGQDSLTHIPTHDVDAAVSTLVSYEDSDKTYTMNVHMDKPMFHKVMKTTIDAIIVARKNSRLTFNEYDLLVVYADKTYTLYNDDRVLSKSTKVADIRKAIKEELLY